MSEAYNIVDYDQYPILFHYTSLNSFEKILTNGSLKLFDITKSNDPQEGLFVLDCLEAAFKDLPKIYTNTMIQNIYSLICLCLNLRKIY